MPRAQEKRESPLGGMGIPRAAILPRCLPHVVAGQVDDERTGSGGWAWALGPQGSEQGFGRGRVTRGQGPARTGERLQGHGIGSAYEAPLAPVSAHHQGEVI